MNVYVTAIVGGILLVSPEPVAVERCEALKAQNNTTLCIEKEPDCGVASGNEACKGAIIDPPPPTRTRRARR